MVIYEPLTTMPSAPAGFTFATSGGGAVVYDVCVQFLTIGGGKIGTEYLATSIQANGLTITIPASIDKKVISINFFTSLPANAGYVWAGGAWRNSSGTFPSTAVIFPNTSYQTYPLLSVGIPPATFTGANATGGSLQSDRLYFLGLGPSFWRYVPGGEFGFVECAYKTGSNILSGVSPIQQYCSVYVSQGYSAINFTFDFCPLNPSGTLSTAPVDTDFAMSRALVYIGTTPEDLMPAGPATGYAQTWAKTSKSSSVLDGTLNVDNANDTINIVYTGGNIPVGACLKYVSNSGAVVTGLVNNAYYYVKSAVATTDTSTKVTLSFSPGGSLIAIAPVVGTFHFEWAQYSGTIKDLPNSLEIIPSCAIWSDVPAGNITQVLYPEAVSGRGIGVTLLQTITPPTTTTPITSIACAIFDTVALRRRDCPVPIYQASANLAEYQKITKTSTSNVQFKIPINDASSAKINWEFESRQYGDRLWMTNNYNEPFYCNGYVLKAGIPSDPGSSTFQRWPITKFLEFYKDRMILASDTGNTTYQTGYFYFSKYATGSGDIQDFSYIGGTTPNAFPVNSGDSSIINGLNLYSQDLTSVGAESFLIIGKQSSVFTWDGVLTSSPRQISRAAGFAGSKCFCLSRFGPVYVGQDNVYLFQTSNDVVPIGDSIKDIIKSLTPTQLKNVVAVYHNEDVKIGYATNVNIDRELWLRLRYTSGGLNKYWTGPHELKEYQGEATILNFDTQNNVRVSYLDSDIFLRDDPGSYLNDGANIQRLIKIRNLGLQQDHLLKLISRVYLATRIVQDETFDITLESQDGSDSIVVEGIHISSGNQRQMKQFIIPARFLARVLTMSIENISNADMSLYDFSILFETLRRRTLP